MKSHRRSLGRTSTRVLTGTVAALATCAALASPAPAQAPTCHVSDVAVSLAEGQPTSAHVRAQLCLQAGKAPTAVQLLIPGITYGRWYWDPPYKPERYSYVRSATAAGYATLAFDRIGTGNSTHPLGIGVTSDTHVWVAHQLVQALRAGTIAGPNGAPSFVRVVVVGHSYGSLIAWEEGTRYRDVDAFVFSGATHRFAANEPLDVVLRLYPALLDPKWLLGLDPTYLTTTPGQRASVFHAPAATEAGLRAVDEQLKETVTATEVTDILTTLLLKPLDVRAPVLLAISQYDKLFCGGIGGSDCSSAAAVEQDERPRLGAHVPSVDTYVLPGGGHDLNFMPNATDWFAVAQDWVGETVPAN